MNTPEDPLAIDWQARAERAEAYLANRLATCPELELLDGGWSDDALKRAYAAGYAAQSEQLQQAQQQPCVKPTP